MNAALVTLNGDIDTCSEWVRTQLQVSSNESFNSSDACTAQALSEFWPQYMRALEDIGKTATMLAVAFDGGGGVDDANEGLVRKLDATFVEYAQLVQRSLHIVRVDCGTYCIKQLLDHIDAVCTHVRAVAMPSHTHRPRAAGQLWAYTDPTSVCIGAVDGLHRHATQVHALVRDAIREMTEQYVLLSMEDGRLVQLCVQLARLCQRAILHTLTWCGGSDAQNASGQASVVSDIDALHDTIDKVSEYVDDMACALSEIIEHTDDIDDDECTDELRLAVHALCDTSVGGLVATLVRHTSGAREQQQLNTVAENVNNIRNEINSQCLSIVV